MRDLQLVKIQPTEDSSILIDFGFVVFVQVVGKALGDLLVDGLNHKIVDNQAKCVFCA